jgi:UDP-N-acetylglucosamine 4,6-dehydratase (inverting)
MLKNKIVLITGGTGTYGRKLLSTLLKQEKLIKKIIIFSRDEFKQSEIEHSLTLTEKKKVRFFLGDVRDKNRLRQAFERVNIVIHAAALKQVPAAEYNPIEFIKTNVIGAQNIIESALDTKIEKVLALSTDKASSPVNLYGATKLCSDKLFIAANNFKGEKKIKFSVLRYGNVVSSRGSIIPLLKAQSKLNSLYLTDREMTRFSITIEQAIKFTFFALKSMMGGEVFIPKLPSYKLIDLAKAISSKAKISFTGIRSGEKIHEEMINISDSKNTYEGQNEYVILNNDQKLIKYYLEKNFKRVKKDFSYKSNINKFLSISELKNIINLS